MTTVLTRNTISSLLESADIQLNGKRPWDIQVHESKFYNRILHDGALGLGESYMDGWWDCERLDIFMHKILRSQLDKHALIPLSFQFKLMLAKIINFQTKSRATQVAEQHYNLGNDLFSLMLDSRMNYSCGYWKEADNLEDAQLAKLNLICQKLNLKPGMTLLDVGCGWGGLAKHAAEHYGVSVVGVTISEEQHAYAKNYCAGLPVDIRLMDYRELSEKFDRIVSVGMFEHVGYKNYVTYMQTLSQCLNEDGLFLLHTIGGNTTSVSANEWVTKYIFPNGMLPSIAQIGHACENIFVMEDWHNFGVYYDPTLMAWHKNFTSRYDEIKSKYDERFYRMWCFYLLGSAGSFRARSIQLWQIVLSKNGILKGYDSIR